MGLIPNIDYTSFKELEGKLNTWIVMFSNDGQWDKLTIAELIDFIVKQPISEREKLHLAISAMITCNTCAEKKRVEEKRLAAETGFVNIHSINHSIIDLWH